MKTMLASLLLIGLCAPGLAAPEDAPEEGKVSRCDNVTAWAKLDALRRAYKGTDGENDVEYLYRLRRFVCEEITAGRLSYENAEPLFDGEKQRIVEEWGRRDPSPRQKPM